jgi:hypothetical protein
MTEERLPKDAEKYLKKPFYQSRVTYLLGSPMVFIIDIYE